VLTRVVCGLLFAASLSAQQLPQLSQTPSTAQAPQTATTATPHGFRIAGVVVNSLTGQPIAAASVGIARTSQGTDREISNSVTTGPDGRFAFTGLSRGKYSLMATARGFSLQYFEHHNYYATAIAVGPDQDSEPLTFRMEPDASIEGDITDENSEPIQNATVRLFQTRTEDGQQKTIPIIQAQTDDLGYYRMGHLEPGSYFLAVSARPWYAQNFNPPGTPNSSDAEAQSAPEVAALDVTYPLTFYPGMSGSADATPLQLTPGEKLNADLSLHAVPSLHLRIHTGSAEGPLSRRMAFPSISQRIFEGYLDPVSNAPDSWVAPGVIEISALAPGHYVLEMPASIGGGDNGGRAWYREIDLAGDADVNAPDGPAAVTVNGAISFDGIQHLPKNVSLQLSNSETGELFRSDITERGDFDFNADNIRPGRYVLKLDDATGFFLERLSATGAKVTGSTIEMGSGSSVHIRAVISRGAAQIDGTVMRDNQPFAGAMIVLVPQDPANNAPLFRRDQSDSDGTFTLPDVVPGQYTVIAIAHDWDLEWANPAALQSYLKQGEKIQVPVDGKFEIKVQVQ
jgi:5-hydroxyisourate hydrolase-like protein (transthyretin family)